MKKVETREMFILTVNICNGCNFLTLDNLKLENLYCSKQAAKSALTKWKKQYEYEVKRCTTHINAIENGTEEFYVEAALPKLRADLQKAENGLAMLESCEIKKVSVSLNYTVED